MTTDIQLHLDLPPPADCPPPLLIHPYDSIKLRMAEIVKTQSGKVWVSDMDSLDLWTTKDQGFLAGGTEDSHVFKCLGEASWNVRFIDTLFDTVTVAAGKGECVKFSGLRLYSCSSIVQHSPTVSELYIPFLSAFQVSEKTTSQALYSLVDEVRENIVPV